jgi:hypothetical protein
LVEDSYSRQFCVDDVECKLEVSITAGQEEYMALVEQVVRPYEVLVQNGCSIVGVPLTLASVLDCRDLWSCIR